jgi:hypothetical protein
MKRLMPKACRCKCCGTEFASSALRTPAFCSVRCRSRQYYKDGKTHAVVERQRNKYVDRSSARQNHAKLGVGIEDYNRQHALQQGSCAICGGKDGKKALSLDHNHTTCVPRGLLCSMCNHAIGMLKDNALLAAKAEVYLRNNGCWVA